MAAIQINPKTVAQLQQAVKPQGGLEFYPHVLFDTQTYTSASTVSLVYFSALNSDKTACNMEGASQLPENQYFEVHRGFFDPFLLPAAQAGHAATGPVNDIAQLLYTGQGAIQLTWQNKQYGPQPMAFYSASGGPQGYGWATMTAEAQVSYAVNGSLSGGGMYFGGRIIFMPKTTFFWTALWTGVLTLAGGNTKMRMALQGILYRAVL